MGRLFKRSVKIYVYPTRDAASGRRITVLDPAPTKPAEYLRQFVLGFDHLRALEPSDPALLSIRTADVLKLIQARDPGGCPWCPRASRNASRRSTCSPRPPRREAGPPRGGSDTRHTPRVLTRLCRAGRFGCGTPCRRTSGGGTEHAQTGGCPCTVQALATQLTIEPPVPLVDRAALLLQDLRERVRRATAEEVQVRSRLLVEQVQRLARLTARELGGSGCTRPVTFRTEIEALERRLDEAPESKVELLACRIACEELSRRSTRRARRRGERAVAVAAALENLRLDARTLFEWAKADLWTSIGRRAIAEASRTASSAELEVPAVLPRLLHTLTRFRGLRILGDELARVAEDLAFSELKRLLTRPRTAAPRTPETELLEEQTDRARTDALLQGLGLPACAP